MNLSRCIIYNSTGRRKCLCRQRVSFCPSNFVRCTMKKICTRLLPTPRLVKTGKKNTPTMPATSHQPSTTAAVVRLPAPATFTTCPCPPPPLTPLLAPTLSTNRPGPQPPLTTPCPRPNAAPQAPRPTQHPPAFLCPARTSADPAPPLSSRKRGT